MGKPAFVERRRTWTAALRDRFRDLEERWNRANGPILVRLPLSIEPMAGPHDLAMCGLSVEFIKTLEAKPPNLLLIGTLPQAGRVLEIIEHQLPRPIVPVAAEKMALGERRIGTLIVHHANRLSPGQQNQLHHWTTQHPLTRVIATSPEPLFPLVLRNDFSQALFFQLNFVSLLIEEAAEIV